MKELAGNVSSAQAREAAVVWSPELKTRCAHNLRRERLQRGYGFDELAQRSGVDACQLRQFESWEPGPTPSIHNLWAIAIALDLPFSALFAGQHNGKAPLATVLDDDGYTVSLVHRQCGVRHIESFLVNIAPDTAHLADPHADGVSEHVVVIAGHLMVGNVQRPHSLSPGQSITFGADVAHLYRSLNEPVCAMVTVVYPGWRNGSTLQETHHAWPMDADQWRGLRDHVAQCRLQCTHGIGAFKLVFDTFHAIEQDARDALEQHLIAEHPGMNGATTHVTIDQHPAVVVLNKVHAQARFNAPAHCDDILASAIALSNAAAFPDPQCGAGAMQAWLRHLDGPGILLPALAAETLLRHGLPHAPPLQTTASEDAASALAERPPHLFEDRIDVAAYCAYELAHPGYARQSVALALAIAAGNNPLPGVTLDVGTGPGTPLKMLLELIDLPRVVAVDPSPASQRQLHHVFAGDSRIEPLCADIAAIPTDQYPPFELALSVGASHHLDTGVFLRSTRRLMATGARFVVADEMISPFQDLNQRQNHLIQHHLQYVLDTLVSVPKDGMTHAEFLLQNVLKSEVPLALCDARHGQTTLAAIRCRRMLEAFELSRLPQTISHPLLAYQRLHHLELQALVAGLDYEIELKTSAPTFVDLAQHSGFTLVHHQRLYATHGLSEWDAGTHCFVLEAC